MKIQLILENQEVELTNDVSIPINKTYENLSNPTDIITDYSKSINIPMTSTNNRILSNSYRLDRVVLQNSSTTNLGIYLDPAKRIPMKLLYNSNVILDGYAKFVSANNTTKGGYYTLNLFGVIGDIFQKLKNVVLSEDMLTDEQKAEEDGGLKYVLEDPCDVSPVVVNADYVEACWRNVYPEPLYTNHQPSIIGFAPSYRGYYNEFESSKIQVNEMGVEDDLVGADAFLENAWKETYKTQYPNKTDEEVDAWIEGLGASDAIGDGLKDYQVGEYRSYMLKPFIYFNKLMQIYQKQITKLSNYTLELDDAWFNINNPYWSRMCYMLDYLDSRDGNNDTEEQISDGYNDEFYYDSTRLYRNISSSFVGNSFITGSTSVTLSPNNIKLRLEAPIPKSLIPVYINSDDYLSLTLQASTYFKVKVAVRFLGTTSIVEKDLYASVYDYSIFSGYVKGVKEEDFIKLSQPKTTKKIYGLDEYLTTGNTDNTDVTVGIDLTIPLTRFKAEFTQRMQRGINIGYSVEVINNYLPYLATASEKGHPSYVTSFTINPEKFADHSSLSIDPIYIFRSWRDSTLVNLRSIYHREESLFDVILQYTKMFGLIWDVDYDNQKIKILHRNTYFKNITFDDWSDRLDRSKDFIIEPITFGSRYISFNYDDVDGRIYSTYRDKYGVNYGDKRIYTGYDFGYENKGLFEGINPSSTSSKSYISLNDLVNWDLNSVIPRTQEPNPIIDCEDEEQSASISLYNWYLRGDNVKLDKPIYLTDDTASMKLLNEYCWMAPSLAAKYGVKITSLPIFNTVISDSKMFPALVGQPLCCVFNVPNEDYTTRKSVSLGVGNAIYDLFWADYIAERYNIQNKKVTGYFNLYPEEVRTFSFSKFVTIDSQLFIINKIFDYNLNSNGLTKVELIQVTNKDAYQNCAIQFDPIVVSPNEVVVLGGLQDSTDGHITLTAHINPQKGYDYQGSWGRLQGQLTKYRGMDVLDGIVAPSFTNFIFTEYGDWEPNLGLDTNILYWVDMDGNKFEGSITYTINGVVYTIPIIIDYTA